MQLFLMRYLLLSSCLFVLLACSSVYRQHGKNAGNASCMSAKFKPNFTKALYKTKVM